MDDRPSRRRFISGPRPRLVLGGLAAAATVSLSGCGSATFEPAEFTSVAQCTSAGFPQPLCDAGYNAAALEHQRSAPRFAHLKSCEDEWGDASCVPASGSLAGSSAGSVFVPLVAGFVLSQALQRRYYDGDDIGIGYYGGYGGYRGSPIYRSRSGNTVTLDRSGGVTKATPVNVNTRTVAASGFGGRGLSRGSFGG